MQETQQAQQHKHVFFSGRKGIETKLISDAKTKIVGKQFEFAGCKDEFIIAKISERSRLLKWIQNQPVEEQKNLLKNIKRLRSEVIAYVLNLGIADENQLRVFNITGSDLLFEAAFRKELINYINSQLEDNPIFKAGIIQMAAGGQHVAYSELNRLNGMIQYYLRKKEELSVIKIKRSVPREKYNHRGEQIEYDLKESPEEIRFKAMQSGLVETPVSQELTLRECVCEIRKLEKLIRMETYRTSALKSKPENLCFYLLYDLTPIRNCTTEGEAFKHRITSLRKSNLLVLLRLLCDIYNETYKTEIENAQKERNNMKRHKKEFSSEEKKFLVRAGKSYGMSQIDVIAQTGFGRTIVQKYWH